jgi:hypothetical protein
MQKLRLIAAFLLALGAAPYSSAQKQALPTHFASWTCKPGVEDVEPGGLAKFANLSKETRVTGSEFCDYFSGEAKIHVELQKHVDPTSAYEMYTALIRPDMQPSTLDKTSAVDGDRLFVLVGSSILEARPTAAISTADLVTLANLVNAHADPTPLPPIRTYLPRGFTDGTQKYALGPNGFRVALDALHQNDYSALAEETGFHSGAEVMLGEYHRGKDTAVLLLIEYPTPQLAEQHLHHLEQALSDSARQAGTTVVRKASLLSLVLNPSSKAYADSLRSELNYETQVTWNEPTHTITDPPWATILGKIILATCLFMVVAVVLGLAFGGVRVLTKIFFPGKIFDRPEQMDVLQLGLSSKRINSRDFY